MFDFIEGVIVSRAPGQATVQVGGFGIQLSIPLSTYDHLPQSGTVRLLAHLHVREDCIQLYGFLTREEREAFLLLTTVKGVGPRLALKILSGARVGEFVRAISSGDSALLCRIPGVGRKTAERLLLELKDAVSRMQPGTGETGADRAAADAVIALITLGTARNEAEKAVDRVRSALGGQATADELVRECLRRGTA